MNLQEGQERLEAMIKPVKDDPFHEHKCVPFPNFLGEIILAFPGNRNKHIRGLDYLVRVNGRNITHIDISDLFIYLASEIPEQQLLDFVIDIYRNGQEANHLFLPNINIHIAGLHLDWNQFKNLIFILVIQENFNFPPTKGFLGIRMPFKRYIEAVLVANHNDSLTRQILVQRINRGARDTLNGIPTNYENALQAIY